MLECYKLLEDVVLIVYKVMNEVLVDVKPSNLRMMC